MLTKPTCNHLHLVYMAVNNFHWQVVIINKWLPLPTVFVARSAFSNTKCCWLKLAVHQVSVVLIVCTDGSVHCVKGSDPTDD